MGIPVVERDIARTELYVCDELFFCGTGAQVAPVRSVDRRLVGSGEPGPVTRRMQERFKAITAGRDEEFGHFMEYARA